MAREILDDRFHNFEDMPEDLEAHVESDEVVQTEPYSGIDMDYEGEDKYENWDERPAKQDNNEIANER